MYPEGPGCDEVIHFIPVDYVAKAVVYLSIEEQGQSLCKHFHYSGMHYVDFSFIYSDKFLVLFTWQMTCILYHTPC